MLRPRPDDREQLVLTFVRELTYFAAGINTYVGAGVYKERSQRRFISNENAAGSQAVVVCRLYGRLVPFPCIHLQGD